MADDMSKEEYRHASLIEINGLRRNTRTLRSRLRSLCYLVIDEGDGGSIELASVKEARATIDELNL